MTIHKSHTKYYLKDGTEVPGVTTALHIVNLPALAPAANKLGFLGINSTTHWKTLADIGSIAHFLALQNAKGISKPDISELGTFSQRQIDQAENSFLSVLEWEKQHKIEDVLLETPMVSETFRYGGTLDRLCRLDGQDWLTLIDYKTGGVYKEHYWQMAAYAQLCLENDYTPKDGIILEIPRTNDEHFEPHHVGDLSLGFYPFLKCLELYTAIRNYDREIKMCTVAQGENHG